MEKKIMINGMMCAHCTAHVEKALGTLEAGTKIYVPILLWNDDDTSGTPGTVESGELVQPTSDDIKGYKVYAAWRASAPQSPSLVR